MNNAKTQIQSLVDKYQKVKQSGGLRRYTEEETKKDFILPLFAVLGWDIENKQEVSAEEKITSAGRVDYGFYLNNRPKFYLESKKLSADLHHSEFAHQAIRYSWNRGVTYAVLTDFESLKLFNSQEIGKPLGDKLIFEIPYHQYIERFEQLQLLSKESFEKNLLDKYAEEHGKKLQKLSIVSFKLYEDLKKCRDLLTASFNTWNKKVAPDLLDEGVQRILDRLIFIRVAEDRRVEPPLLNRLVNEWESSKTKEPLYQSMIKKFRELDEIYNSNLFSFHPSEQWEEHDDALKEVIKILYGKKGYYEYDFKVMPADVLGGVYESYLSHRLAKSKKKITVSKDARKKKEEGIYYTPTFIVDYIVNNALKPVLGKCRSINDLKKIKVLDPACGSGSFLVKALEVINEKYRDFGSRGDAFNKLQILTENIYGVDLDQQAVEIARLNLLVNALDERMRLPYLNKNIKNGNSLISGTDEELTKYFGKNFGDKKPFNWSEQFPEVFTQGGFDVIVGNPPWGADIDKDVAYFGEKYPDSTRSYKDIYKIFIDRSLSLLKDGGVLGFVLPNTFLYQPRYQDIKDMVDQYDYSVINLGEKIFINVQLPSCMIILRKIESNQHLVRDLTKIDRGLLLVAVWSDEPYTVQAVVSKDTGLTFDEVFLLKDAGIQYASVGAGKSGKGKSDLPKRIFSENEDNNHKIPFYTGSNIQRGGWLINHKVKSFFRNDYKSVVNQGEWVHFSKDVFDAPIKIIWRQTADTLHAALMNFPAYFGKTIHAALIRDEFKNRITYEYALAIFNSRFIDYLYRQKVLETGKVFPQVKLKYLRDLPFVIGTPKQIKEISHLAKKMIELNKKLSETEKNSNEWHKLKEEIESTDKKIDAEVYKLYGLKEEEIKIIEGAITL
ncbi:MAG: N-6 DNA methylase [Candidatus Vogelbacteria bacterium]|nr:N-6 DNA methylase [Candidatus Vogelbacteria bacterium]